MFRVARNTRTPCTVNGALSLALFSQKPEKCEWSKKKMHGNTEAMTAKD